MNQLKKEKQLAVISALVEGCSIRSTERMTGVHRDTIMRLLNRVGENCQRILDEKMHGFHSKFLEIDEIWTFVRKKEGRLNEWERFNLELGDQYVFVALDAESKLIPAFMVGKRDGKTASEFMQNLQKRLIGNGRIQITTDGLNAYPGAIEDAFGADGGYAQLGKL